MSILAEYLAVLLLESANRKDDEEYGGSIPSIRSRFESAAGIRVNDSDIREAVLILEPFAAAEQEYSPLTDGFWHIKYDNFRYYFQQKKPDSNDNPEEYFALRRSAENYKVLMAYSRRGTVYAEEAESALRDLSAEQIDEFRSDSPPIGHIPASDRLVTINHNAPKYIELIEVTATADEALRGANSVDSDSKGWIRDHLTAGFELLKKKKILVTAASALLLQPLIKAYEAVTEEPAKLAILAAIKAVKAFFGIA